MNKHETQRAVNKLKYLNKNSFLTSLAILIFVVAGCSFEATEIESVEVSKDKEGKQITKDFNQGDPIHVRIKPGTFSGKTKIKTYLTAGEEFSDVKKGEKLPGSEQTIEINDDQIATFSFQMSETSDGGTYNVVAELIDSEGKTRDTETVEIKINRKSDGVKPYSPPTLNPYP